MLGEWAITVVYHPVPVFTSFIQSEEIMNCTETDIDA